MNKTSNIFPRVVSSSIQNDSPVIAAVIKFLAGIFLCLALCCLDSPVAFARDYISVDNLGHSASPGKARDLPQRMPKKNPGQTNQPKKTPARDSGGNQSSRFVGPSGAVHLFGTVEFKRPLESLPGWLDVLSRNSASPIFQDQKHFNKSTSWAQLKGKLEGKGLPEQMRIVNSFWNAWPYREDQDNWGRQDYWAIPAEFLKKSGDCEDYAIVKYFTLKELGVDPRSMRIVVLRDTIRNLAHAVLVVYTNGDAFILDNLSNVVISHKRVANYNPQYSVNEFGRWAHIKGKKAR